MLVLTRKVGERIVIGDGIVIQVLETNGHRIRLGIEAPSDVPILREELAEWKDFPSLGHRHQALSSHSR